MDSLTVVTISIAASQQQNTLSVFLFQARINSATYQYPINGEPHYYALHANLERTAYHSQVWLGQGPKPFFHGMIQYFSHFKE